MDTPILFLIFNRPDLTQKVFNAIKEIKPKKLYVVADGPRLNKQNEDKKTQLCRKIIDEQVDWDCEVKSIFRDENLGSGLGIYEAINWFFDQEEYGIILEDDCLPNKSFFYFCDELLKKYIKDDQIMHISGNGYLLNMIPVKESYYFSQVPLSWGWATWRRSWKKMNYKMADFEQNFSKLPEIGKIWENDWKDVLENRVPDAWDFQWYFTILSNNGYCIHPAESLIENIGFCSDATHTTRAEWWYRLIEIKEIYTIKHPNSITINEKADAFVLKLIKNLPLSLFEKILLRLKNLSKFI
jgi:hypothetical protein